MIDLRDAALTDSRFDTKPYIMQLSPRTADRPSPLDQLISEVLAQLNVPARAVGYPYIKDSLHLMLTLPSLRPRISLEIYPMVAEHYGVSSKTVDRAIRSVLLQTWQRGGEAPYFHLLGRECPALPQRPTNNEFLFEIAQVLRLMLPR